MDSTKLTGDGLGRYVNDAVACEANCKMSVVEIDRKPHLALFATKVIMSQEELRYDYGVPDLPWRTVVSIFLFLSFIYSCLQCFNAVGWAAGRASDL